MYTYSNVLPEHSSQFLMFLCSILPGLKRMCIGIAYATVFTVLGSKVPVTYLTTDDFAVSWLSTVGLL